MDLSYEAQLIELRRRFTDDAQVLEERGLATGDSSVSRDLFAKAAYATTALRYMDELDRTGLVEPLVTHCDPHCPFLGCASCEYAGGESGSAAWELPSVRPVDNRAAGVGSNGDTRGSSQRQLGVPNAP